MSLEQLALFGEATPAQVRTWNEVRPGERFVYTPVASPWRGRWTVRHVEPHPASRYTLIVDLIGDDGRLWPTWIDRRVQIPGPGFLEDHDGCAILGTREDT